LITIRAFEIVYTTSEDENDAAVNIWGSVPGDRF
jgi:hypothetical protein